MAVAHNTLSELYDTCTCDHFMNSYPAQFIFDLVFLMFYLTFILWMKSLLSKHEICIMFKLFPNTSI